MSKIIDKIRARRRKHRRAPDGDVDVDGDDDVERDRFGFPSGWYHSFEYFPPKTEPGLDNLLVRIDRMARRLDPLFVDVTWGESGSTSARTLAVAGHAQRYCGVDVLMHLTCMGLTREQIARHLDQARLCGVRNVLALRGDPPRGKRAWERGDVSTGECRRAIDLVRLIRELHGDYFGIAVAGHPEGHPASFSREEEMAHLREKMDAGADLIITQFFYDAGVFLDYVKRCRSHGIRCPILPGIMPIQSYTSFTRMTSFCGISVPDGVMKRLEPVKDDDEAVKRIGCEIATDMCRTVLTAREEDGGVDGVHFYTLNLERSATRILVSMGAVECVDPAAASAAAAEGSSPVAAPPAAAEEAGGGADAEADDAEAGDGPGSGGGSDSASAAAEAAAIESLGTSPTAVHPMRPPAASRPFPWRPSAMESRSREDVRPINWANRPKSYVMRTDDWDEFPNGRWGDATSPAFGELSDVGHFLGHAALGTEDDRRAALGSRLRRPGDVHEVFARYVEGTVPHVPWCETPLQPESFTIQRPLAALNRAGFLTVNSQPPVDGAPSSHPVFGWGGAGGRVYQRAYCECFASPDRADRLVSMVSENPAMNLYAVNNSGRELRAGAERGGVTALTWGAFPNREILQPTIFDPDTFLVWAEEAFSLWTTMWIDLYEPGSESYDVIETIRDTYYLVAIIDNDYTSASNDGRGGNLFQALLRVGNVEDCQ